MTDPTSPCPDVLVIGAGVFGLATALAAVRAGLRVRVVEAARPGAGASGGPVGALIAHGATRWGWLQALQQAGLASLPSEAEALAQASGQDPAYRRSGRIVALGSPEARLRAFAEADALNARWGPGSATVLDRAPAGFAGWLDPKAAASGVLTDRIGARLSPQRWLAAQLAALATAGVIIEHEEVLAVDVSGTAQTRTVPISAGHIVVAAGIASARLLAPHGIDGLTGVKGQAARIAITPPPDMSVIAAPGLYITAQGDHVALGSTSERLWQNPGPDNALDAIIDRARALVPALRDRPVTGRWAGIRPRGPRAGPLAGPVPGAPRLMVATGGYKIGFALAHLIGAGVVEALTGTGPALPPECLPTARASRDNSSVDLTSGDRRNL